MRVTTSGARRATAAVLAVGFVAACTGSDDAGGGSDVTTTVDEATSDDATFEPVEDGSVEDGSDVSTTVDGFDPEVVDEALVPEVVEEIVLDDDVIIATEDGQIPTTTVDPVVTSAASPPSTAPPPAEPDASTTTLAPPPPPPAATIERVVSLSPTHTETIGALGAAGLLIGVDVLSDAPAGAPIEFDRFAVDDLDPGQLRELDVDLVVLGEDVGGVASAVLAGGGIPSFVGAPPTTRAGVEEQILDLAEALGREQAGIELVESMRDEVAAVLASLPATEGLTYFHEIDPGYATYTSSSLVDSLYGELGLRTIVPPSEERSIFATAEDVLRGDPDVIVLGDIVCCAATAERAAARPGWSELSAVQNGAVVEVPDDVANRFGVNIVELMRLVAAGVAAAA